METTSFEHLCPVAQEGSSRKINERGDFCSKTNRAKCDGGGGMVLLVCSSNNVNCHSATRPRQIQPGKLLSHT